MSTRFNREDYRTVLPQLEKIIDELEKSIEQMGDKFEKPFVVNMVNISSRSYAANAAYWFYNNNVKIPQITGYTPVGAFCCTSNSGGLIVCPLVRSADSNNLYGFVRNITSSAITQEINIPIMYVKDALL